jgi:hypothetical protein
MVKAKLSGISHQERMKAHGEIPIEIQCKCIGWFSVNQQQCIFHQILAGMAYKDEIE